MTDGEHAFPPECDPDHPCGVEDCRRCMPLADPRGVFRKDGMDTTEVLERLAQINPMVAAVLNAARAMDINPHGDRAVRECLLQLHVDNEDLKRRLGHALEVQQIQPLTVSILSPGDPI